MSKQTELAQVADTITVDSGNVGINTSSPSYPLHVDRGATGDIAHFEGQGSVHLRIGENSNNMYINANNGNATLAFQTNGSERMRINSSGNVGIGSVPSYKLHVEGAGNQFIFLNNASTNDGFYFKAGSGASSIQTNGGSSVMNFFTAGTERMRIDAAGRVTMPYQPCFNVGLSNNFTPSGNFQVLPFNDTSSDGKHNIGGHYATSGGNHGKFIAPVAGRYFFHALVLYQDVSNGTDMNDSFYIRKNGNTVAFSHRRAYGSNGTTMSTNYFADHASTILNLGAGDYVQIILKRSRTVHGNTFYSYFSGNLIG